MNAYSNICHLDLYHKAETLKYWQGLGCIFPLLLWVGGWLGGLSVTGNKANLNLSLSWDWIELRLRLAIQYSIYDIIIIWYDIWFQWRSEYSFWAGRLVWLNVPFKMIVRGVMPLSISQYAWIWSKRGRSPFFKCLNYVFGVSGGIRSQMCPFSNYEASPKLADQADLIWINITR